jgi:hypothetical protein
MFGQMEEPWIWDTINDGVIIWSYDDMIVWWYDGMIVDGTQWEQGKTSSLLKKPRIGVTINDDIMVWLYDGMVSRDNNRAEWLAW